MPLLSDGSPITRDTVFDKFAVFIQNIDGMEPAADSFIYSGDQRVGKIEASREYHRHRTFNESDPEVIEIQRRLDSGECTLHYEFPDSSGLHTWDELQEVLWYLPTVFPFHEAHVDPHHFFAALGRAADYVAPTAQMPARFIIPGIIEGASRRYYKRDDDASVPDIRNLNGLASAGWTDFVPYGSHRPYAIDVLDHPNGLSITGPESVYFRRKNVDGAIRSIARKWHEYWSGLDNSAQSLAVRRTLREHVETAIGRAWVAKPFDDDISVFYESDLGTRARRAARYVEDWYLGNLEEWAHGRGFPAMALALNEGSNRSLLQTRLDDHSFCLINEDGGVGDILANPADGILEATWTAWGTTHFNAALGTVVTVDAGDDKSEDSNANVALASMVNVVNGVGSTTYQWEQVSGDSVTLGGSDLSSALFVAPTLAAGDDPVVLVFRVTATNNGESASDTITVTVNPPVSE